MPCPLSIRIFMGCGGQLGDSRGEGNKKSTSSNCKQLELDLVLFIVQMGATGPPRYTLIFGKDTTFLSFYNFFKSFLINQLYSLHKTIILLCLLVKLCQYEFLSMFLKLELLNIKVSLLHIFHSTYHWHDLQIFVSIDNR